MKIAIRVGAKVASNLRADNLRSERRWERSALEALLEAEWLEKVYSLFPIWQSNEQKPDKLIDGLPLDEYKDTICIFSDFPRNLMDMKFKAVIINSIGEGETPFWEEKRMATKDYYGYKFVYIMGYFWPEQVNELRRYIGEDFFEFLPIPLIPEKTDFKSQFDNNIILWPRRGISTFIHASFNKVLSEPFEWIASKMASNSNIEFHILSGEIGDELVNRNILCSSPNTSSLVPYINRVIVHNNVGWSFVQELYSKAKIVILPLGFCFQNSEIEAATCGIPTIQHKQVEGYPWILVADWNSTEYYQCLNKLYTDADFYAENGFNYKSFVDANHTYKAFSDNLYNILVRKQLL